MWGSTAVPRGVAPKRAHVLYALFVTVSVPAAASSLSHGGLAGGPPALLGYASKLAEVAREQLAGRSATSATSATAQVSNGLPSATDPRPIRDQAAFAPPR